MENLTIVCKVKLFSLLARKVSRKQQVLKVVVPNVRYFGSTIGKRINEHLIKSGLNTLTWQQPLMFVIC